MKNILLITTMYPTPNSEGHTPVCHYFARDWRKMGYNVIVIHFKSVFPIVFYKLATQFRRLAIKVVGNDNVDIKRASNDISFIQDDVSIYSFPIFKFIPHGKYNNKVLLTQINKIVSLLELERFIPDIIIGHFFNPQVEIVSKLKQLYPNSRSSIVLHEKASVVEKLYSKELFHFKDYIDVWGFRSDTLRREFEKIYWSDKNSFINYSGISDEFLQKKKGREFSVKLRKFLYVGQLIERKYPAVLIPAIDKAVPSRDYHVTYLGIGSKDKDIKSAAKKLGVTDNLTLEGKLSREKVLEFYDNSDCFIMISKNEAFGLVYLEAMSRGCITIGARNEGIDGVIKHGINGFLCEAGNSDELAKTIRNINSLSEAELMNISNQAMKTARKMTDYKVAEKYINSILTPK